MLFPTPVGASMRRDPGRQASLEWIEPSAAVAVAVHIRGTNAPPGRMQDPRDRTDVWLLFSWRSSISMIGNTAESFQTSF